jgi:6-hydroxycyclohex-1-ene-1-carbonyl-CoA dehydrogenase
VTEPTLTATGTRWQMTEVGAPLEASTFELPRPGKNEVLVSVAGCGVCHTDLGFLFDGVKPRAGLPITLGHEISGVVVDAGADAVLLIGKAVIVPAVMPCGECELCRAGHGTICRDQKMPGNDIDGGFASHTLVPAPGLCVVDEPQAAAGGKIASSNCTLAQLSVVADAVTTPYQAMHRARVDAGDFVVVVGLGGVGGFAAQIAGALGATVVGFDVNEQRLEMLGTHGLAAGFDPSASDPRALRKELRAFAKERGHGIERWKIFECSGTAAGQNLAYGLLGPGAYLSIVGFTMEKTELRLSNLMAFDAKAAGNWGCLPELYPAALQLVLDGKVALEPFVETHPLSDVWDVLNQVREHRLSRRPVLIP